MELIQIMAAALVDEASPAGPGHPSSLEMLQTYARAQLPFSKNGKISFPPGGSTTTVSLGAVNPFRFLAVRARGGAVVLLTSAAGALQMIPVEPSLVLLAGVDESYTGLRITASSEVLYLLAGG